MLSIPFDVLPEFKVSPSPRISLIDFKPQKPIVKTVWILNNYGKDFEIESTSSQSGTIKVLSQEKVGKRYKFELQITPPAADGKRRFFTDIFFVNIKGGEKLEISCRGFYPRKKVKSSRR